MTRRTLVYAASALAILLVGAAVGMLITLSALNSDQPPGQGSIDVGFAQDMKVHHVQAITMAGLARDTSQDTEVKQLAFDIESTQQDQNGQLTGWLIAWGQPILPDPGQAHMTWMPGSAGHDHMSSSAGVSLMPGMATTDELTKLRKLTGRDLDVYFLQLMLRHHQGGLAMAEYAAQHAGQEYVRNLADKIAKGQAGESTLLKSMLAERGSQPLP